MQIKRIQCPQCGVVLDVKNSKNENIKEITCPSCNSKLNVIFESPKEPIDAHTYYKPSKVPINDDKTQLAGTATKLATPKAENHIIELLYNDVSYPLYEGRNIIGRKGNTSNASVQIATEDRYMSRQHCCITITTMAEGKKKIVLSNYQNKNLTVVNGQNIEKGDEIRLTDGNCITMGHTTVIVKIS